MTNTTMEYTLYFDGCSKGNPGEAGAGAVIYQNETEIWSSSVYVGAKETNNVAEYTGMILGLTEAVARNIKNISVKGDSMLVIKQMRGEYKVNSSNLKELFAKSTRLVSQFDTIAFAHVYRDMNKRADTLSNDGILLRC
jgi:ribonuclease HI